MAKTGTAKKALCVGINDYPGTGSDLGGCVNDAKDWKSVLETRGFAATLLLDGEATRSRMVEELQGLVAGAPAESTLIFTYSGHGSWLPDDEGDEPDGRDEMLCPHDVAEGQYLMDDDLALLFAEKTPGTRLFFISDSCHSGTVARLQPPLFPEAAATHPRPRFLPPATFLKSPKDQSRLRRIALLGRSSRQKYPALLAAGCRDVEYSYDAVFNGRPNGAFTRVALEVLKKGPRTPREWMTEIRKHLPTATYLQTPSLFGSRTAKDAAIF
ncbi:MAG: caspase family protein [Planctomycetota bacterium]